MLATLRRAGDEGTLAGRSVTDRHRTFTKRQTPGHSMQRLILWGSVAGLASCLLKPQLVAITPDYGYVDGCIDVTLSGQKLGENATARIGSLELELTPQAEDTNAGEHAQDRGFEYTAQVGPAPDGPGWYDVTMTVDGKDLVLKNGFYYRSCPASFSVDAFGGPADPTNVVAGDQINLQGCGLGDQVTVEIVDPTTAEGGARSAPPRPKAPPSLPVPPLPPPTGDTGATVPTGETGTTGTDGTVVPTGETGVTGTDVTDGTVVPTGETGTAVPTGETGTVPTGGSGGSGTGTIPCECTGTAVATLPLVSDCSTSAAHADIPDTLAAGTYCVRVVHTDGTSYSALDHFDSGETYTYYYGCPLYNITVGGAK
jgi:hypothetical protein